MPIRQGSKKNLTKFTIWMLNDLAFLFLNLIFALSWIELDTKNGTANEITYLHIFIKFLNKN